MNKLEALKYICKKYKGSQGGFQMACLIDVVMEDKEIYSKEELDLIIIEMNEY